MSGFTPIRTLAEVMFQDELLLTSYGMNFMDFHKKITTNGVIKVGHSFSYNSRMFRVADIKIEIKENISPIHPLVQIIHYQVEEA